MTYCIYTDTDGENVTPDHVFPLSLGGCNEFCVPCETNFNSLMGEDVDGPIANDPLVMFARRDADARGHSGAEPTPVWKKSEIEGRPTQVSWAKDKARFWDARSRAELDESTVVGKEITSSLRIDRFADIRFVAKVALGGAHFIYGDTIRTAMNCNELRRLITLDPDKAKEDPGFRSSAVRIVQRFSEELQTSGDPAMYKLFCEGNPCSTLIAVPHHHEISFHVGVVGMYLGSVVVPAKTDLLPIDGLHDVGHVVWIADKQMHQASLRDFATAFHKKLFGQGSPSPPEKL
jgi:hypothetical protein